MHPKLLAGGTALLMLAFAAPGQAYHIEDNWFADGTGFQPLEWTMPLGIETTYPIGDPLTNGQVSCQLAREVANDVYPVDPGLANTLQGVLDVPCTDWPKWEAGDPLVAAYAIVCEANPDPSVGDPGNSGIGGLCFMNPGFTTDWGTGDCLFVGDGWNQGNSNGLYNPYQAPPGFWDPCGLATSGFHPVATSPGVQLTPIPPAPRPSIAHVARQWYEITMQDVRPSFFFSDDIPFVAEIGGFGCGVASMQLVYDEQFAYTVSNGHVTGYPVVAPPLGTFGGYYVYAYAGNPAADPALTNCSPYPMHY